MVPVASCEWFAGVPEKRSGRKAGAAFAVDEREIVRGLTAGCSQASICQGQGDVRWAFAKGEPGMSEPREDLAAVAGLYPSETVCKQ